MIGDEGPIPESEAAPQGDSRGRIAAAVVWLVIAVALVGLSVREVRHHPVEARDFQARYNAFVGNVLLGLTYELESLETDPTASPGMRKMAAERADLGVASATQYFEKAAAGFKDPDDRTAAVASAAALHVHQGDNLLALQLIQRNLSTGRADVLSLLARLFANQRPTPEWLQGPEYAWIHDHVQARLLIESDIVLKLARLHEVQERRDEMADVGARVTARVGGLLLAFAVFLMAGTVLLLIALVRGLTFAPYAGLPARAWGLWAGLELFGIWLALNRLVPEAVAPLVRTVIRGEAFWPTLYLLSYTLASVIALAWFAASVTPRGTGLRTAGWQSLGRRRALTNGLGAYAAAIPIVAIATVAIQRVLPEVPTNPITAQMIQAHGWMARALFILLLCVIAPIAEETVFRGGLYGGLRQRCSVPVAAVVASVIFAAVHLNLASFVPIFALGVALCVVYEKTGSLWPGMIAHGVFNLGTALAIILLS